MTDDLGTYSDDVHDVEPAIPTPSLSSMFPSVDDTLNEEDETFTITIGPGTGYTVGSPSVITFTIIDDDPPAAPGSLTLTPGNAKLDVSWAKPAGPVAGYQVRHKTTAAADQTATTANDPTTGWVTATQSGTGTTATISSLSNTASYDVQVRATDGQTATGNGYGPWTATKAGTPQMQMVTTVTVSLSAPSTVPEGSSVTVTARLSAPASSQVTIPVTLTNVDAESADYGTLTSITINSGATTGTGTISTNQDTDEDDETFTVALGTLPSGYAAGSPSSVQIRIADDEGVPEVTLHVSRNLVKEGRWTLVEVRLKKGGVAFRPPSRVHIPVIVRRGTLESGDLQSLLRHASQQTQTFTIGIGGDYLGTYGRYILKTVRDMDTDDETFTVELDTASLPPSVQAGSPSSVRITIADDGILRAPRNPRDPDTDEPPTDSTPTIQPPPTDTPTDDMQSADATLSALEIEEASLDFDPDTYTYTLNAYDEETVTLTPTANHEDAEITVNADRVESGSSAIVPLDDDGVTSIEIVVTAEDGATRTYTLAVMSCPGEERKILEMFYDRTQGDMGWIEDGGWNTQDDLHDWHGVRTENGRVAVLSLPDNDLSGDIPSALLCFGGLEKLSELALWDNDDLSGEVPDGLALPVERAVLRAVAGALELNTEWFEDYGEPFNFKGWHEGVTMDEDGRVTELDFSDTEEIEGTIPAVLLEQLKRLETLYVNCTVSVGGDAPAGVNVEEVCEEPGEEYLNPLEAGAAP